MEKVPKILVTGGAGYIGSVLVPVLVETGHEVIVVDKLIFGNNLKDFSGFTLYERNVFNIDPEWLNGVDAVIHLAGLSNDPMANFKPSDNFIHNSAATAHIVHLCKQKNIKRFIFSGSCSVYGYSAVKDMVETDSVSPSFPYAISKIQAEYAINIATDENFRPIIFRQATVYGLAPRMRFDLVVNTMTKSGVRTGKIVVNNPALWRPLIYIKDLAQVYLLALAQPLEVIGTYNISSKNYTILQIAEEVQKALLERGIKCELDIKNKEDMRNYRVSTAKAEEVFKFHPKTEIGHAVKEILDKIGDKNNPAWENKSFINFEVYKDRVLNGSSLTNRLKRYWKKII